MAECGFDDTLFPAPISDVSHLLRRASAASAEMGTKRIDAIGRCLQYFDQASAIAADLDADGLAGQRPRHKDRFVAIAGNAVAPMADIIDCQNLFARRGRGFSGPASPP